MRTPLLAALAGPYACERCGVTVRTVRTIDGHPLIITNDPAPNGNIIPWPASTPTGLAEARILTHPINDGPTWVEHSCGYH